MFFTPSGTIPSLYADMLEQNHLIIAGATGAGKSVVENGIIYSLLHDPPIESSIVCIDPKRVELVQYVRVPHCIGYASEPYDITALLAGCVDRMESRYKAMQRKRQKLSHEGSIYIFIDELADIMTTQRAACLPLLQRLAQLGRAAKIHVVALTQVCTATVLSSQLLVNFSSRVALHTRTQQDSRNIIGMRGAESLPLYGQCIYYNNTGLARYNVPMIADNEIDRIIRHWTH